MDSPNSLVSVSRSRGTIPASVIKIAFGRSANRCAFPECPPVTLDNGVPLLEIAHISSLSAGGPRYSPSLTRTGRDSADNIIILCPTHHALADKNPEIFTTEELAKIRDAHFERVQRALSAEQKRTTSSRLADLLEVWNQKRATGDEEYWQQLFSDHPEAFSLALEGRAYTLSSKCYVGGKSVGNRGGNVLDFLAQHSGNVALVEIKTPATKLLAPQKYRGNVYAPSRELAGSTVQALEYRYSLISNLPALAFETPGLRATQPMGVVIIGDLEKEAMDEAGRRSFELYRSSFRDLKIMTYDELFGGIQMLVDILSD
ncbi:Shedu anti-phage system protein SduA domain-containing protein [Streptomyces sp900116325]|uniref:Shedu immune nuclease family protein n=1 Tax=Streptomyces sp. 900116325 TaxID=3154295 RepID=UPI0033A734F5